MGKKSASIQHSAFFTILKYVVEYSFDKYAGIDARVYKSLDISDQVFLDILYIRREVEDVLKVAIMDNPDYICLIGLKGSGKSSTMLKVKNDIELSSYPKYDFMRLDMYTDNVRTTLEKNNYQDFYNILTSRVKNAYLNKYFQLDDEQKSNYLKLYAFILTNLPNAIAPESIFSDFQNIRNDAHMLKDRCYTTEKSKGMLEWLFDCYPLDDEMKLLFRMINDKIDISHLIWASKNIFELDGHVILFDNVDVLPDKMQGEFAHHIETFYGQIAGCTSLVITIRTENIVLDYAGKGDGAHPNACRIYMELEKDATLERRYPAYDIKFINIRELKRIFFKRLDYAVKHQPKLLEQVKNILKKNAHDEETKYTLSILNKAHEPLLSSFEHDELCRLFRILFNIVEKENIIYLVNSNIRDILRIIRDFAGILVREGRDPKTNALRALHCEEWLMITKLYAWLSSAGRRYNIGVYNIVKQNATVTNKESVPIKCVLPYLVITTIWNLQLTAKDRTGMKSPYVRINDVYQTLGLLGYKPQQIREILLSFYKYKRSIGMLINFKGYVTIEGVEDIKPHQNICLLPQAKTLASHTAISFGYFYGCTQMPLYQNNKEHEEYSIPNTGEAAQTMLPFLIQVCQTHCDSLKAIRDNDMLKCKQWLSNYYKYYGMPIENPYSPISDQEYLKPKHNRLLLGQALLYNIAAYVRNYPIVKIYNELIKVYDSSLERLEYGLDQNPDGSYTPINIEQQLSKELGGKFESK